MNIQKYHAASIIKKVAYTAFFVFMTVSIWAQDTSTTKVRHGSPTYETKVRNATVVYVEGNDLVLKLEDGKVEHLVVPDSDKFTIDDKVVSVFGLTPGTKLTQSITTTTTPRYVNSVRILKGKIWHVNAPGSVIVTLPEGKNHQYLVPSHAKFFVNGQPKTVFDLRKGMTFEATIVTDETHTLVSQSKSNVGQAPAPALPPVVGVLLIQPIARPLVPAKAAEETSAPVTVADAESYPATLPKTATPLPLVGLLGALAVAVSLGMGRIRRRSTI
jgi:hypothetical protein